MLPNSVDSSPSNIGLIVPPFETLRLNIKKKINNHSNIINNLNK